MSLTLRAGAVTGDSGTGLFSINCATLNFPASLATPSLQQAAPTTDAATAGLTISAQSAFASASTNVAGGNLTLNGGNGATGHGYGTGSTGQVIISLGGTAVLQIGNYQNSQNGDSLFFPHTITMRSGGSMLYRATSGNIAFEASSGGVTFGNVNGLQGFTLTPQAAATLAFDNGITTSLSISVNPLASVGTTPGTAGVPTSITTQAGQATSAASGVGGAGGATTIGAGAGGAATGTTSTGGAGGALNLTSGAGGTGTTAAGAVGKLNLQLAGSTVESYTPTQGTKNSQVNRTDIWYGNCETASSATPAQVGTYTTVAGEGGWIAIVIGSRATTAGTGITVDDSAAASYVLCFRNHGGTVSIASGAPVLVGSSQTTNSSFTAPVLTATVSGAVITFLVKNVSLCTVDSTAYFSATII
jgi:hypothetical protein